MEELNSRANTDVILFNQRVDTMQQEQSIMKNELAINQEALEKMRNNHQREMIKLNLDNLAIVDKLKVEN